MLSLNFLLNCNVIFKVSLYKLCFYFNELRIFQSPSYLCFCVKWYCILCPPSPHFHGSDVAVHPNPAWQILFVYEGCLLTGNPSSGHNRSCPGHFSLSRELRNLVPGTSEPHSYSKSKYVKMDFQKSVKKIY